ncbi:uncharacterized protein LOC129226414 [Uloborus diversus]|uniref:uncharacterized protein LOC129226414 n=1 Tax=Uloborus diversus TaxID=327109 RepID=UPI00240923F5|nr:uncharacterized protein LOC129226414 [Uloborus diversus]
MENYQFIRQIAQGTFSEVWLVKCSKTRKKFVLKQIDLHHLPKREQRSAHLDAKLLSTVKHPHIATYLDSFYNSKGNLFIVMCFFENGDLFTFIENQNDVHIEEKQIVHWFVQMCMALKYLHDRKILHRNLKTKSIFLTKNNLIKIADFGISKALKVTEELAETLIGVPCYLSPETYAGKNISEKSDVWALGCCMYELAALKYAFDAHSLLVSKSIFVKEKLALISGIYSSNLLDIISSMLSFNPESRPSATELLLTDYVRKHIVIFLQDTPRSASSNSNVSKSEETQEARCKYHLLPFISKEDEIIEYAENNNDISIRTIPDINGNGDGNDNSQQRANVTFDTKFNINNGYAMCTTSSASSSAKSDLSLHYTKENKSIRTPWHLQSVNSCESLVHTAKQKLLEKQKGEYSFKILNNLSCTLGNSSSRIYDTQPSKIQSSKTKYLCEARPPTSAELSCDSKLMTPPLKSDVSGFLKDFSEKYYNNHVTLPYIFDEKFKAHEPLTRGDTKDLSMFKSLRLQNKNISAEILPKKDSVNNVFKLKTMECNKFHTDSRTRLNQ